VKTNEHGDDNTCPHGSYKNNKSIIGTVFSPKEDDLHDDDNDNDHHNHCDHDEECGCFQFCL
jgi:hypothetical protein